MNNSDIKNLEKLHHKKYRDEFNKFLIEGIHLIEECLRSDIYREMLETIFVREDFENESAIEKIKNSNHSAGIEILDDRKFSRLSETVNSQGIIGLVSRPDLSLHNEKIKTDKSNKIVVAIDNISDPGNLGTIIRTCHWFGADELIISKNSVDVFNSREIFRMGIAPEGTRKKVTELRTGFYFIAHKANVPIIPSLITQRMSLLSNNPLMISASHGEPENTSIDLL